jgi:3-dehydro-4-phosphotetronate decarboxylase
MRETDARETLVRYGKSLYSRGYTCGTSGNLSVRLGDDGYLMSPTNVSLGELDANTLARFDRNRKHVAGATPTKEAWLHFAMYKSRPNDNAVVHLHSTYGVALSCLADRPSEDVLPPLTPYVVMRVGRVARVPYARPGDTSVGETIEKLAISHRALLLANHGPVVSGPDLAAAVSVYEELEETAKLFFVLGDRPHECLSTEQTDELRRVFGSAT